MDLSPARAEALNHPWGKPVTKQIKSAVHDAANKNQKIAMFHYQVLMNADELEGVDPRGFCREIAVPETYATEFTKMIALARLMREQGNKIV